jgi:hypothetical protein
MKIAGKSLNFAKNLRLYAKQIERMRAISESQAVSRKRFHQS